MLDGLLNNEWFSGEFVSDISLCDCMSSVYNLTKEGKADRAGFGPSEEGMKVDFFLSQWVHDVKKYPNPNKDKEEEEERGTANSGLMRAGESGAPDANDSLNNSMQSKLVERKGTNCCTIF